MGNILPPVVENSVVPFSSCPQTLPASESFPMSQLFAWGGQNTGASALASFLPKNTQDWSPLRWTGWISFQSKGLFRVFSNITVQKHQFFDAQLSSQSNSHIHSVQFRCSVMSDSLRPHELQYSSRGGNKIISQNENHLDNSNSSVILSRNSLVWPKTKKLWPT